MMHSLPFQATRPPPADASSAPLLLSFPTHAGSAAGLIAQVTLASPGNLNALRSADFQQLIAILEWINEQPTVLITVLTGHGRFFSAGANVADPARIPPTEVTSLPASDPVHVATKRQFYSARAHANNRRLSQALFYHDKLLVAALNGPVVGIVAAAVAYCDFVYCFEECWLATPFTSLALVAEGGSSATFVKKVSFSTRCRWRSTTNGPRRWVWEGRSRRCSKAARCLRGSSSRPGL